MVQKWEVSHHHASTQDPPHIDSGASTGPGLDQAQGSQARSISQNNQRPSPHFDEDLRGLFADNKYSQMTSKSIETIDRPQDWLSMTVAESEGISDPMQLAEGINPANTFPDTAWQDKPENSRQDPPSNNDNDFLRDFNNAPNEPFRLEGMDLDLTAPGSSPYAFDLPAIHSGNVFMSSDLDLSGSPGAPFGGLDEFFFGNFPGNEGLFHDQ